MKKMRLFSLITVLVMAFFVVAQDGIHGVDGYYNWTAKQIQADKVLTLVSRTYYGSAVTKAAGIIYNDEFVRVNVGLANNNATPLKFRTDMKLNYNVNSPLKITKQNPVIAFKIGYPEVATAKDFFHTFEVFWKFKIKDGDTVQARNTSGAYQNCFVNSGINGTAFPYYKKNGNGTGTFGYGSWKTSPVGRFDFLAGGASSWKVIDGVYTHFFNKDCAIGDSANTASTKSSTITGYFKVNDPVCKNIFYVNFKQVVDSVGDIEIYNFVNMLGDMVTDTTKTVILRNEAGDSIGVQTVSKTRDELPYYLIKWIKTFPSLAALKTQVGINNGDGNDVRSDNQLILNSALYYAKKTLQNYAYSDPKFHDAYQSAFDAALLVYQSVAPGDDKTSAEWLAWDANVAKTITDLATAKDNFLKAITAKITNPYNKLKTGNGEAEFVLGQSVTLSNGVPGKLLVLGGQGSGTPFLMTKSATLVNGRIAYTLSNVQGKVCISKDTLLFVNNDKLSLAAATPALFVFSNRSDNEYPAYDISVNGKFLYLNSLSGKLATIAEIPDGEISELAPYLFDIAPATYDPSGDANVNLLTGWEFENGSLEGFDRNNWRMYSKIENTKVDEKACMMLSIAPNYYTANDSTHTTLLTSDFVTGMEGGYRRESGVYPTSAKLNPTTRDSSLLIWTNTYQKRYLAIKTAGTAPGLVMNKMTLYATPQIFVDIALADTIGRKGDVYYYDLLAKGIPYGNIGWNSQYFSAGMFHSENDKCYVDWIRFYPAIQDIPNEILDVKSGVFKPSADNNVRILVNEKTIEVNAEKQSEISVYTISGVRVATQFTTELHCNVFNQGIYIVTVRDNNRIVSEKVMVK